MKRRTELARIERFRARDDLACALEDLRHRRRQLSRAFGGHDSLRLSQEQRILHELAQSSEAVTHRRGRHVQAPAARPT